MNTDNNNEAIKLLENKIENIVRAILREKAEEDRKTKKSNDEKSGFGDVETDEAYKRRYKAVEDYLNKPEVDATQVMAKALGFDPKDDSARSHMFKKLHKELIPDGSKTYEFNPEEISKIYALIG